MPKAHLTTAIKSTFERRNFPLPKRLPIGLTNEFSQDQAKQQQWKTFLNKNQVALISLDEAVNTIQEAIEPILNNIEDVTI